MRRCQLAEQGEVDSIRPSIWRSFAVYRHLSTRYGRSDRCRQVSDLIIPIVAAGVYDQMVTSEVCFAHHCPLNGAGHVLHIDQRTPGRPVTEHCNATG